MWCVSVAVSVAIYPFGDKDSVSADFGFYVGHKQCSAAKKRSFRAQMFVATHDGCLLDGVLIYVPRVVPGT